MSGRESALGPRQGFRAEVAKKVGRLVGTRGGFGLEHLRQDSSEQRGPRDIARVGDLVNKTRTNHRKHFFKNGDRV